MYATSKLIIPPKPARNSPFIPKLRIKLKPSLNRNRLVHGTSLRNSSLLQLTRGDVALRAAHSPRSLVGGIRGPSRLPDSSNTSTGEQECRDDGERLLRGERNAGATVTRRASSKRKQATLEMDNLDLEGPESILTKVSLKALINRDTFYTFPVETQRMLADLLPYYDKQKHPWSPNSTANGFTEDDSRTQTKVITPASLEGESVWLHPSALNNEFFTKALQDYTDRQSRGEFAPRLRNRAGLRAHAVGRRRYGTAVVNTDLANSKQPQKTTLNESGSNYEFVRRTARVKDKAYTSLARQSTSRSRNRTVGPSLSAEKLPRSLPKGARRSQNLSPGKHTPGRMKLRRKSLQSIPSDHVFSEESPFEASPATTHTDVGPTLDSPDRSPIRSGHSNQLIENHLTSSNPVVLTPKSTKIQCQDSSGEYQNSVRTSFSSSQGLDLCDGFDTSYSLTLPQKQSESLSSPKGGNHPSTASPSVSSTTLDSKSNGALSSPRPGRNSRGLASVPSSTVPPTMPPPRQTKTLAAMREKLRAKRMMKEAERHPSGQNCYSLPGSMTPHPASGSSGYFHQPTGYTPSGGGFGSPLLPPIGLKRSASTLSSPQNLNSTSPTNCDKQPCNAPTSVSLCALLNGTGELGPSKLIPNSPSSPHSLPNAELSSPLLHSSLNADFLSHISLQDNCTFGQELSGQSYPSSPLSTNSSGGVIACSGTTGATCSPQSAKPNAPVIPAEIRQEQSASAPPTPVLPQAGQTMLTFSPLVPTSSYLNPGSIRLNQQSPLPNTPIPVSSVPHSLPLSHPTVNYQNHSPVRPVLSMSASNAVSLGATTIVPKINPSVVASQSITTNHLHPPSIASISVISSSSVGVPTAADARTSLPYSTSATLTSNATGMVDAVRSPQSTAGTTAPLPTQLSASAAVTKLLVGSSQNRPSTTTRAFFVDGDNLSEAVALLQTLNPKATITQQQFLLIPSSNKSQMFLCPTPSTSTTNILSVPVSTSVPSTTITPNSGLTAAAPNTTATSLSVKSTANQTTLSTVNLSGIRQLSVSTLNTVPSQMTVNQFVPGNAGVSTLDPTYTVHSKMTNMVVPTVATNTSPSGRSLICTKSVMSYAQPNTPNLIHLKPQPKLADNPSDRLINKTALVVPRRTVASVNKSLAESVYATPVTQSQIAFSLLAPNASVLNTDTPVMFVSETHPATYSPRQVNLSTIQSSVSSLDRTQTLVNSMGTVGPSSITLATNQVSGPVAIAASTQMTVISPTQLNSSCDLHLQPQTQQRVHSIQAQLHGSPSIVAEQAIQSIRAAPISYTSSVPSCTAPSYLSATTIMSTCLPAVVLPPTLAVQSPRTNVITTNHVVTTSHPINNTDHTVFRPVP